MACACVSAGPPLARGFAAPTDNRLIQDVPFYPDAGGLGGASALAALLAWSGQPARPADFPGLAARGKPKDLVLAALKKGAMAYTFQGTPEALVDFIDSGQPVILHLARPVDRAPAGSFVVAVGRGPEGLVVNTPDARQLILPWSDFLAAWHKAAYAAIILQPPTGGVTPPPAGGVTPPPTGGVTPSGLHW